MPLITPSASESAQDENHRDKQLNKLRLALYQRYAISTTSKSKKQTNPLNHYTELLAKAGLEKTLVKRLEREVIAYARDHLNQVGTHHHYTNTEVNVVGSREVAGARKDTKSERVAAVNLLLEMLKTSSAKEVYSYVTTPAFERIAGNNEVKLNVFRRHLASIISDFTHDFAEFQALINDQVLIDTLTTSSVVALMTAEDWCVLLVHYNPRLIADLILSLYPDGSFEANYQGLQITSDYLRKIVDNDQDVLLRLNRLRASIRAPLLLPEACLAPGKNTLREEGLSLYQLYQYEDTTVAAVENWLYEAFTPLLVNNVLDNRNLRQSLNLDAPYHFYLIPTAEYMLLDPVVGSDARYGRYKKYRQDVRSLVMSASQHRKPVIFCSIMNLDGVHYVAVFIHRAKNGVVSVVCVDPSARMYPGQSRLQEDDPKLKAERKLRKIYEDVFSWVEKDKFRFEAVDVAQMLRERDCGPNAATTVFDALNSCMTDRPLLKIGDDGRLHLEINRLTVKAQPVGVNPYTDQLVYAAQLDEDSLASRAEWEKRITAMQQVRPFTIRERGNPDQPTIHDEFLLSEQIAIDYNYREAVERQQSQDAREVNLSAVRSLLISSADGNEVIGELITAYQQDLHLPSTLPLERFLKASYSEAELSSLTQAHAGDLTLLCENVILVILKDAIPHAFISVFDNTVLTNLPQSLELDHEEIVDSYIHQHQSIFSQLTIYQQSQIRSTLNQRAKAAVIQHLISLHWEALRTFIDGNMQRVIDEIELVPEQQFAEAVITNLSKQTSEIHPSVIFLQAHDGLRLSRSLAQQVKGAMQTLIDNSVSYLTADFAKEYMNLNDVLSLFGTGTNTFIPWTSEVLAARLPKSKSGIVSSLAVHQLQGAWLLEAVNKQRYALAVGRLNELANQAVRSFIESNDVSMALMMNQDLVTLTEHVYRDTGVALNSACLPDISALISQFGSTANVTMSDYQHSLTGLYIHNNLSILIGQFYSNQLQHQYRNIQAMLLSWSPYQTYADFKAMPDRKEMLLSTLLTLVDQQPNAVKLYEYFPGIFDRSVPVVQQHFAEWFNATMQNGLWVDCNKFDELHQRVTHSHAILTSLKARLLEKGFTSLQEPLDRLLSELSKQRLSIESYPLMYGSASRYAELSAAFMQTFKNVVGVLQSRPYSAGEIKPDSFTTLVRPALCQLLNRQTASVMTLREASDTDASLQQATRDLSDTILPPISEMASPLLCLPHQPDVPDTYGKPLTRHLILELIAYWQSHYSWRYSLAHVDTWVDDAKEPEVIQVLMRLLRKDCFDEADLLLPDVSQSLRANLLSNAPLNEQVAVFGANDIDSQIKAALLRTATLANTKSSTIQFKQLVKLFNLPVTLSVQQTPVVSPQAIQERTLVLVRAYRAANPGQMPNMAEMTAQAKRELLGDSAQPSNAIDVYNIPVAELARRSGLFGSQLFSGGMNHAEKILLQLRQKHAPQTDFALDEDDILVLRQLMRHRWKKLCDQYSGDQEKAFLHYYNPRERTDKVYIALAELVARHYRDSATPVYLHALLMPDYQRYAGVSKLVSRRLPASMELELGVDEEDGSCLDDIPLSQLVITENGYALNMQSIIQAYQSRVDLTNPYTKRLFTEIEIQAICAHPRAKELVDQINNNAMPRLTERALKLLVDYLNGAIFNRGFGSHYSASEDNKAFSSYATFTQKLTQLPENERKGLLNEPIPGSNGETVQSTFKASEVSGRGAQGMCLTLRGVALARVVIAYKGDHHGLTNRTLVDRAKEIAIPRKVYESARGNQERGALGVVEGAILREFELQQDRRLAYRRRG